MTEFIVPLHKLRFGHEAPEPINARVEGREDGIAELAANLHAHKQIENVVVKDFGDGFLYVSNGNRRLAAWRMIYGADSDFQVRCTPHDVDAAGAFEQSLTTAVTAKPLHPVDKFEAFAKLAENGRTEDEIARLYGMTEIEVRRVLALGSLSPKIRDAWRAGEIKTEAAQAFTMLSGHKAQDKVFAKLEKANRLNEHAVREELGAKRDDFGQYVNFVGIAEYEARGGKVTQDLFKERHMVSDPALLKAMVTERLEQECARLVADGWQWATIKDELPSSWRYSWERINPKLKDYLTPEEAERAEAFERRRKALDREEEEEGSDWSEIHDRGAALDHEIEQFEAAIMPRCFTDKQKKSHGCVLNLDDDGRLDITYGVKRPAAASRAAAEEAAPTAGETAPVRAKPKPLKSVEAADVSNALTTRLSEQLTRGAETALIQDRDLAISVLLAAFATREEHEAVKVYVRGYSAEKLNLLGAKKFADNLELARAMTPAQRVEALVLVAGAALDLRCHNSEADLMKGVRGLVCEAIAAESINSALRGGFDAADYFDSVSKAVSVAAIKEALGADIARQQEKGSKADIAAFAVANVPATGWLPPQLRVKGYDGPPNAKPSPAKGGKPADRAKRAKPKAAKKAAPKKAAAKKRKAA